MSASPEAIVTRKSTPLTNRDLADLDFIRRTPSYAGVTESKTVHDMVRLGLDVMLEQLMDRGYQQIAEAQGDASQRRAVARRRRPAWADEP